MKNWYLNLRNLSSLEEVKGLYLKQYRTLSCTTQSRGLNCVEKGEAKRDMEEIEGSRRKAGLEFSFEGKVNGDGHSSAYVETK